MSNLLILETSDQTHGQLGRGPREEVLAKISTLSCVDEEVTRLLAEAESAASRAVVMRGSEHPGYEDQIQLR